MGTEITDDENWTWDELSNIEVTLDYVSNGELMIHNYKSMLLIEIDDANRGMVLKECCKFYKSIY